jgi:hypothetical protein
VARVYGCARNTGNSPDKLDRILDQSGKVENGRQCSLGWYSGGNSADSLRNAFSPKRGEYEKQQFQQYDLALRLFRTAAFVTNAPQVWEELPPILSLHVAHG